MEKIEIRRRILEMLYEKFTEHPYYRITPKEFKNELKINLRELNYNVIYLEEKGLIELQKPLEGSLFVGARITTKGVDLVEDEYKFNMMFPLNSKRAISENIFAKLHLLQAKIESTDNLSSELREIIIEEIKGIEEELKKPEPSYTTVKKFLDKLKQRNFEIYQQISTIMKEPMVIRILSESAKKEL